MRFTTVGIHTEPGTFSAAVMRDGIVVSAIEQFKIRQHWSNVESESLPNPAICTALAIAKLDADNVDRIAFASDLLSAEKIGPQLRVLGFDSQTRIEQIDPQLAHCIAAYYGSPFERSAILVLGTGRNLDIICSGIGEGIRVRLEAASGGNSPLLTPYKNIWNAPPEKLETGTHRIVIEMAEDLCRRLRVANICIAGMAAENPFLARALEQYFGIDHVFVAPAPGSESVSIGAALASLEAENPPSRDVRFAYPALGPAFADSEIKSELDNCKLVSEFLPRTETLIKRCAKTLADGRIVGWLQGRCEFGHRALGFRSIFANPFTPYIDENINRFLKHRESSHPFVISIPEEVAGEYFHDVGQGARTIASLYAVKDRKAGLLSSFTIQQKWIRLHTVRRNDNFLFWTLLHTMEGFTGHPLLINTSFNLPGEPLVMTPRDAIRSFYASGMDALAMGSFFLNKS